MQYTTRRIRLLRTISSRTEGRLLRGAGKSGTRRPAVMRPLNVIWFRLGLLLGAIVTPIVMGLLYVTTFVPTSLILRLAGRDLLGLEREPDRASYWVARDPPGGGQSTMKRQF